MRGAGRCARIVAVAATALAAAGPAGAAEADSLGTVVPRFTFDAVPRDAYLRRHAYSLDHFLEFEPGGLVVRYGPIGNDAFYSRRAIGRGRAILLFGGIPMNDPQSGAAPFIHTATSGADGVAFAPAGAARAHGNGLEGFVSVDDAPPSNTRPRTFVELSKGDNDLRQRRVRFWSQQGEVGLDLSYDEVLDDGYAFDASGQVGEGFPDYGKSRTRNGSIVLRGKAGDGAHYAFGLRRYRSNTEGDLASEEAEANRGGHLAWMDVGVPRGSLKLYGRGFSSTYPDSASRNETAGAVMAWDALRRAGSTLSLVATGERTRATQDVGGASARDDVARGGITASAELGAGAPTGGFLHATAALEDETGAWGAGAGVTREIPRGVLRADVRRAFRMPSIGERYLPAHTRDGRLLEGSAGLDAETAWEAGADWVLAAGSWTNRVRAGWMAAEGNIAFRPVAGDPSRRRASNLDGDVAMTFIEERVRVDAPMGALRILAEAAGVLSNGDRSETFASVPRLQAHASLRIGGEMFEASSALYGGVEYAYVDERRDFDARLLPAFHVVNFSIEGRLIDARLYLRLLNAFDEAYQTQGGYLMTPRTLVYGIEWTLFD
jgi:hypothetical protein